jgi:hypothetical protein
MDVNQKLMRILSIIMLQTIQRNKSGAQKINRKNPQQASETGYLTFLGKERVTFKVTS